MSNNESNTHENKEGVNTNENECEVLEGSNQLPDQTLSNMDNAMLSDVDISEVVVGLENMTENNEDVNMHNMRFDENETIDSTEKIECTGVETEQITEELSSIAELSNVVLPYVDHGYCRTQQRDLSVLSKIGITRLEISNVDTEKIGAGEEDGEGTNTKKIKLDLNINQQNVSTTTSNNYQRQRKDPCPPLTKEHIDLLLGYLSNPALCATEQLFLMQLKLSNFPRVKRYSVASQLKRWSKYLMKRKVDGQETLCLRVSEKVILPKEKYASVIKDAHENSGCFYIKDVRKRKEKSKHNSFHKTYTLIEAEYGVGGREFGMSKYTIYEHVANCSSCTAHQKRLPSISKVLSSSDNYQLSYKSKDNTPTENIEDSMTNTELSNESGAGDEDAPISMLWEKPSPGSIWHNQQGLASQLDPYEKLLGVIKEIGLDLTSSVQGDIPSKGKFLTKLYCATRLIQEMKSVCEKGETSSKDEYNMFMSDYLKLQDVYVDIGQLDLFLYDVNLLAIKYNLTKSELFMQVVNNCVSRFNKINNTSTVQQSIFDTPIDLVGIDVP